MKVLICGDRNWTNRALILDIVISIGGIDEVIEGEARGADSLGREVAEELGIPVSKFPADWDKYSRSAGFRRNIQMLDQNPDLVLAFHNDIDTSRGTAHTVGEAKKRGIPTRIITE